MGFGYPAAMGAKIAHPDKQVIDIDGDGSFLMNIQELATAHIEKHRRQGDHPEQPAPRHGGAVGRPLSRRQSRAIPSLAIRKTSSAVYPDYVEICKGFGVPCERILHKKDVEAAIKRMLDSKETYVLDIMTPYTEHVLPMIPSGMTYKDIITE